MSKADFLAHSPRENPEIPAQSYVSHVQNVTESTVQKAASAAGSMPFASLFVETLRLAAEFHDLGKLDPLNQCVLMKRNGGRLPVNHVDAGVAALLRLKPSKPTAFATPVIYSHHQGMPNFSEFANNRCRDIRLHERFGSTKKRTDEWLDRYLDFHRSQVGFSEPCDYSNTTEPRSIQLMYRMALSCLVDADHFDTSLNYQQATQNPLIQLRPTERLRQLDQYIDNFGHPSDDRNHLRGRVYRSCRDAESNRAIVTCNSPVGSGKTTAVMAHLLRVAGDQNLRRIFVVLPFTNIITQSVDIYRSCLSFVDENPEQVVAAHHHRAEFSDVNSRSLTYLWESPIVVTTAVQFFETLAAAKTGALRKLHQLAASAIFIDESHAALPAHLWPVAWQWLCALRQDWNCHIVLGSGSLSEFWTLPEFADPIVELSSIVNPEDQIDSNQYEANRVRYRTRPDHLTLESIVDWVKSLAGPRLLIVNTVQSAAYIAQAIETQFGRNAVEHLSTSLTPDDRSKSLKLIRRRLQNQVDHNWTLVATSCVEAGVDFSFRTGFRERSSLNSLLQTAGRVNRSGEYGTADVWDLQLQYDHRLRKHPAFEDSAIVLGELFEEGKITPASCTLAMQREIRRAGMKSVAEQLCKAEAKLQFCEVEDLFRVINTDTVVVVVEKALIRRLRKRDNVSFQELQNGSVQIYSNKLAALAVEPIHERPGLFAWTLNYNRFIGYMAGVINDVNFVHNGCVAI